MASPKVSLESLTVKDLKEMCAKHGLQTKSRMRKADLIECLVKHSSVADAAAPPAAAVPASAAAAGIQQALPMGDLHMALRGAANDDVRAQKAQAQAEWERRLAAAAPGDLAADGADPAKVTVVVSLGAAPAPAAADGVGAGGKKKRAAAAAPPRQLREELMAKWGEKESLVSGRERNRGREKQSERNRELRARAAHAPGNHTRKKPPTYSRVLFPFNSHSRQSTYSLAHLLFPSSSSHPPKQSTAQFRTICERHGVPVAGMAVCRVIARANGGAAHPDNYLVLGREAGGRLNRYGDHLTCYLVGRELAARAVAVSATIGNEDGLKYKGKSAELLFEEGGRAFEKLLGESAMLHADHHKH